MKITTGSKSGLCLSCAIERHRNPNCKCIACKAKRGEYKGKNNGSYIDGRSKNKRSYRGEEWNKLRFEIYKRDNYICQECGIKCISKKIANKTNFLNVIQCHHIKKYKNEQDNNSNNLITLCVKCHFKSHNVKTINSAK